MSQKGTRARRGWKRVSLSILAAVLVLILLVPTAVFVALRTPGFRSAVLSWASEALADSTGIEATARDFRLRLLRGELELLDIRLAASGSSGHPLVECDRAWARLDWISLLSTSPRLHEVELERPRLDLNAPWPNLRTSGVGLIIDRFTLSEGKVEAGSMPETLDIWLDAWGAEGVEATGSLGLDLWALTLESANLAVESHRRPTIEAKLSAGLRGTLPAHIEISDLELRGEGEFLEALSLKASGQGNLGAEEPLKIRADLVLDPARLFPDLTSGGFVTAQADLAYLAHPQDRLSGALTLDVRDLPAILLEPFLSDSYEEVVSIAGTVLDVTTDLQVDLLLEMPEMKPDRLVGSARATWRRESEILLGADLESMSRDGDETLGLRLEADLLPASPGRRHLSGAITAPSWAQLSEGHLHDLELAVEADDLVQTGKSLGFAVGNLPWWPQGEVSGLIEADGPLLEPRIAADVSWVEGGLVALSARARTDPVQEDSGVLTIEAEVEALPGSPGRRAAKGTIHLPDWRRPELGTLDDGRVALRVPDLASGFEALRQVADRLFPNLEGQTEWPSTLSETVQTFHGALEADLNVRGDLLDPWIQGDVAWLPVQGPAGDHPEAATGHTRVSIDGPVSALACPSESEMTVGIDLEGFNLARLASLLETTPGNVALDPESAELAIEGRVDATGEFAGACTRWAGNLELTARDLRYLELPPVETLTFAVRSDAETLQLETLRATLAESPEIPHPIDVLASGSASLRLPSEHASVDIGLVFTEDHERNITISLRLLEGMLEATVTPDQGTGTLTARAPLSIFPLPSDLSTFISMPEPDEQARVELRASNFSVGNILALLEGDMTPEVVGRIDGALSFDPMDIVAAEGKLTVSDLDIPLDEVGLLASDTLEIRVADGRIDLPTVRLEAYAPGARDSLQASGSLVLDPDWHFGDDPASLVADTSFELKGTLKAEILTPLLGGGIATGNVTVESRASGPLSAWVASFHLSGPEAEIDLLTDLAVRISAPEIRVDFREGELRIESARATINRGTTEITGGGSLDEGLSFSTKLDDVRFRLDYGLSILLDGDLALDLPPHGFGSLSGKVTVQRGLIRRDLDLDRELLSLLLEPPDPAQAEDTFLDAIRLQVEIDTLEGVSVDNNLARLHTSWDPLSIRGTLANPSVAGTFNVDPGSLMSLFGQVVRIDEAELTLFGDSGLEPRLIFESTSSIEDSSIQHWDQADFSTGWGNRGTFQGGMFGSGSSVEGAAQQFTTGVSTYYSDRLANALTGGFSTMELAVKPLPIFGESDTEARLTATQQLSTNARFLTSVNPRDAEGRTNMLEFFGYAFAPSLKAQLFNDDDARKGATLQRTRRIGSKLRYDDEVLRLRKVVVEAPKEISARAMRSASGFSKGDLIPDGSDFDVEVDINERLREIGYPTARVRAKVVPVRSSRAEIQVVIEPGPKAEFLFTGERLPKRTRRAIAEHYRPQRWVEAASLERMRAEAERALRGRGYLEPQIEISVDLADTLTSPSSRTISVHSEGGRQVEPELPSFKGVPEDVAQHLQSNFVSPLARVELAAGVPEADRFLLSAMRRFGFRQAEVLGRELSEDGKSLVVDLEPGPRIRLGRLELEGVEGEASEALMATHTLRTGEPGRADQIVAAAYAIERDLKERGHRNAKVGVSVDFREDDPNPVADITFDVHQGPRYVLASARFEGSEASSDSWLQKTAAISLDEPYREQDIGQARGRLFRTGVFEKIRTSSSPSEPTENNPEAGTDPEVRRETVTFDLTERPRYSVSYGGKWREEDGLGLVIYAKDDNFLGRGQTFGLRTVYAGEEKRLGSYWALPRVRGGKGILEAFLEWSDETDGAGIRAEGFESWLQYTFPTSPRTNNRAYVLYENREYSGTSGDPSEDEIGSAVSPYLGWQFFFDTRQQGLGQPVNKKDNVLSLDLSGSSTSLGSDFSVLRMFTQFKTYRPAGRTPSPRAAKTDNRWIQSFRIGLLEPFDGDIPVFERLKAGGEFSVRGYARESLGPLDENGNALGGEVFFILNEEIHVPVWGELAVIGFFDAGNVWLSRDTVDSEIFKSIGVGLRANTPIGPLRLDLALPLDRREGIDPEYKVYFGIGPTF